MITKKESIALMANSSYGVYIPQYFIENFNPLEWDGSEETIKINDVEYYVFDNH